MLDVTQLIGFGNGRGNLALALTAIGNTLSAVNNSTVAITTTAEVVSGESIIIGVCVGGGATVSSIADSASNTYTKAVGKTNASSDAEIWECLSPTKLASGSTITVTLSGNSDDKAAAAVKTSRRAERLSTGNNSGSSTTPSATTAVASPVGSGAVGVANQYTGGTVTQPGGIWVSDVAGGTLGFNAIAHAITTTAATVTYNPTSNLNSTWAAVVASYGPDD